MTDVPTIAVDLERLNPRRRNQRMAGSDAIAASQDSRIRNRKCRATPTTQAATIHAETITRILIVVACTLRWSNEMRIRLNSGWTLGGTARASSVRGGS